MGDGTEGEEGKGEGKKEDKKEKKKLLRAGGQMDQPEVVQEVLTDLKRDILNGCGVHNVDSYWVKKGYFDWLRAVIGSKRDILIG